MVRSSVVRRPIRLVMATAIVVLACADPTSVFDGQPLFSKGKNGGNNGGGSADPVVSAVDPSYGYQGETIARVRITGSGFDQSAVATWERNGIPDPMITVHATRFVSSSELEADISIAQDADIDLYDVAVTRNGGKRGVGIEMFEVTTAQSIGALCTRKTAASIARGLNESGMIVGESCGDAFVWSAATGMIRLDADATATDIDEAGTTISGVIKPLAGGAVLWTRTGNGWQRQNLPSNGWTGRANAIVSDPVTGLATIIGGRIDEPQKGNQKKVHPVLWFRDENASGGWRLVQLPLPDGVEEGMPVIKVSRNGRAVPRLGPATVWEPNADGSYTAILLPGGGRSVSISPDGTLIVGSGMRYWRRGGDGTWTGPFSMMVSCEKNSNAWTRDVNDYGVVVGMSCDSGGAWQITESGVIEIRLPGFGRNDSSGDAWAVTNTSPARAVGNGASSAVYWDLPF